MINNWKKRLPIYIITSLIILVPMFIGIFNWQSLPEQLAVHFTLRGKPNGYWSKGLAVYGGPLGLLLCQIVVILCYLLGDKISNKKNIPLSVEVLSCCILPICSIITAMAVYGYHFCIKAGGVILSLFGVIAVITILIVYKTIKGKKKMILHCII